MIESNWVPCRVLPLNNTINTPSYVSPYNLFVHYYPQYLKEIYRQQISFHAMEVYWNCQAALYQHWHLNSLSSLMFERIPEHDEISKSPLAMELLALIDEDDEITPIDTSQIKKRLFIFQYLTIKESLIKAIS